MEKKIHLAPKVVVIIGNGFDLDLGLKTRYSDFVSGDYFHPLLGPETPICNSFFDLGIQRKNMIMRDNNFAKYVKEKELERNWVDLEQDIKDYCLSHKTERNSQQLKKEIYGVRYFLYKYIQFLDTNLIKQNPNLDKTVAYQVINALKSHNAIFDIWNFNYTNTCSTIMKMVGFGQQDITDHLHAIHGSIEESQKSETINILLGTRYDKDIMRVCPSAIKSFVDENYADRVVLFRTQLQEAESLLLFGHSMGDSDAQYFVDMFKTSKKLKRILVINYNEEQIESVRINLDKMSSNKLGPLWEKGSKIFKSFKTRGYLEKPFMNSVDPKNEQILKKLLQEFLNYSFVEDLTLDV